ncbi:DUF6538 domain-containing protein [Cerasicoccus arenae]|nr:DUF6538 domain-containing protein [Cerasicoccus arenae]MBK1858349.1 hypothetical protein [Cerasicoccus arenae]
MPKRPDGLVNRKGSKIFYCRKRVPEKLVPIIGRKKFMVSLKTADYQEAKRKLRSVKFEIEQKIDAAEQKLERSKSAQPTALLDEEVKAMAIDWFIKHEQDLDRKYRNLQPKNIGAAVDGLRANLEGQPCTGKM